MQNIQNSETKKSIHHQRRWFYLLWSTLLALSLFTWTLWVIPGEKGYVELTLLLRLSGVPNNTQVQVWVGPKKYWPKPTNFIQVASFYQSTKTNEVTKIGPFRAFIAYRRWIHLYIPEKTDDLIVITFTPVSGAKKYLTLALSDDINTGLLTPPRRMTETLTSSWSDLNLSSGLPINVH